MPFENINQLIHQLKAVIPNYCDKCGSKYTDNDFEMVQSDNNKAVCKLSCKNCSNSLMMHVNSMPDGMGMMSARSMNSAKTVKNEVTAVEKMKFKKLDQINNDDVLDVFNSLKKINNIEDFNSLF